MPGYDRMYQDMIRYDKICQDVLRCTRNCRAHGFGNYLVGRLRPPHVTDTRGAGPSEKAIFRGQSTRLQIHLKMMKIFVFSYKEIDKIVHFKPQANELPL